MKKLLAALLISVSVNAVAGIQVDETRVIYNGNAKSASLDIRNDQPDTYMVQTWLDNGDARQVPKNIPIQVVPPVLKVAGKKEAILRFIYSGTGLPQDRESVFWVNVQEIPPAPKQENVLQIAVRTRVKLFYRPEGLNTTLAQQADKLKWHRENNNLVIENAGPLNVTLGVVKLKNSAGKTWDVSADMVKAFDKAVIHLPAGSESANKVQFTYINDFGGNSSGTDARL
ncbi:fimbrial biogenesis chaperone [Pantoea sp. A4]|uniref:fimbrial biogenesis chaperone n=1 Tax=Pantoea sp. A4 TaxID=1225184 RepID=UPI00035E456A|nr:molecular chaperone [Pantoea sp. A4]